TAMLDEALSTATTDEWLARFAGRVPAAPVNDIATALDSPHVRQGSRIWDVPHPAREDFRMVAAPFNCPGETLPKNPAPPLGQDTDSTLAACGYGPDAIAALRRDGVI